MTVLTGIFVYFLTFWVALFAVLPWGNRAEENKPAAHMGGAPAIPRIREKFIATAIVSAVLWVLIYLAVRFEVVDFYAISRQWSAEDFGS